MTLAKDVDKLEREYSDLKELCGEIIATLTLEKNAKTFEKLPSEWHKLVAHWKLRYKEVAGKMITTADIIQQPSWIALEQTLIEEIKELEKENQQDDND